MMMNEIKLILMSKKPEKGIGNEVFIHAVPRTYIRPAFLFIVFYFYLYIGNEGGNERGEHSSSTVF